MNKNNRLQQEDHLDNMYKRAFADLVTPQEVNCKAGCGGDYCGCFQIPLGVDPVKIDQTISEEDCWPNGKGWPAFFCESEPELDSDTKVGQIGAGNCGCGSKSYRLQHEDYMDNLYKRAFVDAGSHPDPVGTLNHCCVCDKRSNQYACQILDPIVNRGDIARRQKECRKTGEKYGLPSHHVIGSDCGEDGHGNCKHDCWPTPVSL